MSLANVDLPVDTTAPLRARREEIAIAPGAAFLTPAARAERLRAIADAGYLVARISPAAEHGGIAAPGSLGPAVSSAVELSLALRGALPPAVEIGATIEAAAGDQLFRIRALGAHGLCLAFPSLARLAPAGLLHPDDGAVLRHFVALALTEPLVLLFDAGDRALSVLTPLPLDQLCGEPEPPASGRRTAAESRRLGHGAGRRGALPEDEPTRPWGARALAPALGEDDPLALDEELPADREGHGARVDLSTDLDGDLPDDLGDDLDDDLDAEIADDLDDDLDDDVASGAAPPRGASTAGEPVVARATMEAPSDPGFGATRGARPVTERGRVIQRDPLDGIDVDDFGADDFDADDFDAEIFDAADFDDRPRVAGGSDADDLASTGRAAADLTTTDAAATDHGARAAVTPVSHDEAPSAAEPPDGLALLPSIDACERHCRALEAARGPKPVRAIEELFTTRYLPLREALSRGLDDLDVEEVVAEWAESFAKSYREAFKTMKVTGKRPNMVLDAPEVATRIGRAHGARAVQLVLVDAMRFDLGQRVKEALAPRLAPNARCVEETVLWSALPAMTPTQMRLLAQGPRGLRENEPASERDVDHAILRAGSAATLRRVRIGQRDLVKLDLVEARLREAGGGYEPRMASIAEEVAEVIAAFAASLPPRTLLFVFGDHGFELPVASSRATGSAKQGGASPDEVLVGGQGWLLGAPADRT